MDDDTAAPPPSAFGELMECLDIVTGLSQMPQGSSRSGSSHITLGSVRPQSNTSKPGLQLAVEPNFLTLLKTKLVEPVSFYPCI
jgi:hypothetical protein